MAKISNEAGELYWLWTIVILSLPTLVNTPPLNWAVFSAGMKLELPPGGAPKLPLRSGIPRVKLYLLSRGQKSAKKKRGFAEMSVQDKK